MLGVCAKAVAARRAKKTDARMGTLYEVQLSDPRASRVTRPPLAWQDALTDRSRKSRWPSEPAPWCGIDTVQKKSRILILRHAPPYRGPPVVTEQFRLAIVA